MEPTAPAIRKTPEEYAAMFADRDTAMLAHINSLLDVGGDHAPAPTTVAAAEARAITLYQGLLDDAEVTYTAEADYNANTHKVQYWAYLKKLADAI